MKVIFYGGQTAGLVVFLGLAAQPDVYINLDQKKMNSECETYNQLYPVYLEVLRETLLALRKAL